MIYIYQIKKIKIKYYICNDENEINKGKNEELSGMMFDAFMIMI